MSVLHWRKLNKMVEGPKICLYCEQEAVFVVDFTKNIPTFLCNDHKESFKDIKEIQLIENTDEMRKKYLRHTPKHESHYAQRYHTDPEFRKKSLQRSRKYRAKMKAQRKKMTTEEKEENRKRAIDETFNEFLEKSRSEKKKSTE